MEFTDWIFELSADDLSTGVPWTEYQEYTARRFRIDRSFDTERAVDRFKALLWYVEGYGPHRKPMNHPFSAAQVKWLLEPEAPYIADVTVPRIVEAFRRRALPHVQPYDNEDQYQLLAYWWAAEMSPAVGVSHFAVPDQFISVLKRPVTAARELYPITAFMKLFAERQTEVPWLFDTPMGRLASYIRVLLEPWGTHYALFFPSAVIAELEKLPTTLPGAGLGVSARDLEAIREKVAVASAYAARHKELRSGRQNVNDPNWVARMAEPARTSSSRAEPLVLNGEGSVLPSPVRVIGPINSQSGLGQASRMSVESLLAAGVRPKILDFYLDNPAPRLLSYVEGSPIEPDGNAINLIHLNAESIPLAAAYLDRRLFDGAYNIGYFFWELPRPARCHELAIKMVDEIWVSSEFNVQAYRSMTDKPVRKVGIAVETLSAEGDRALVRDRYGLSATTFVFMSTFDSYSFIQRKNPAAVLRAFLKAFEHRAVDVHLIIKTHNLTAVLGEPDAAKLVGEVMELAARDRRITLIDSTLPFSELLALKQACDVYVTLHRSEGWGFGAVEAMQLGLPVIATAFSGNLEFCTPETSYSVGYTPVYLERDDYIFVQPGDYWAEPDVNGAAQAMTEAFENPEQASAKGRAAKAFVEKRFSSAAIGETYLNALRSITELRGPQAMD